MADVRCPNCGLVSRIPDGTPANCVRCGMQLPTVPQMTNMQYAPQPEQQYEQPYGAPVPQYQQPVVPEQQINVPEVLKHAQKKRRDWHILNGVLYGIQTAVLGLGATWDEIGGIDTDMTVPLIGAWLASLVLFSFVSARLRPDAYYLEKPPFIRNKWLYGIFHFLISLTSFISSAVLYAILAALFE